MNKEFKSRLITIAIIIGVILVTYFSLASKPDVKTDEEILKCISENSILYVQLGCSHCEIQKEMFGEYKTNLNIVDCSDEKDLCITKKIVGTPSWEINGEIIIGLKTIEELKELAKC